MNPDINRPHFLFRLTALFLFLLLMFSNSSGYSAPAPSSPQQILIPEAFGRIDESSIVASSKTIVYIQDAHDSLEAQENIAKIIQYLVEHNGVKTVFEEGYEGPVPTDKYFNFVKNPTLKEKISYFLMDKLRLGGAEYAHVNRTKDFKLIGADSIKLHLENIKQYQESAKHKAETDKDLETIGREIKRLADQYFPKELKEWMKLKERFDDGALDLLTYLKRVTALTTSVTIPQSIRLLLEADQRNDKRASESLKEIAPKVLFREIDLLENAIADYFLRSERDRRIFQHYNEIELLKRLNDIRLSPDEYELVKSNLQKLQTENFARTVVGITGKSIVLSKRWEQNIQNAMRFYEIAEARDLLVEKSLDQFLASRDENLSVMVFGGFHKNRLREIIRRKGISCFAVSPKITAVSKIHQRYYRELMSVGRLSFEPSSYVRTAAPAGRVTEVVTDTDLPSYLLEMSVFPKELKAAIRSEMRDQHKHPLQLLKETPALSKFIEELLHIIYERQGLNPTLVPKILDVLKNNSENPESARRIVYETVLDFGTDSAWKTSYRLQAKAKYERAYFAMVQTELKDLPDGAVILDVGAGSNDLGRITAKYHPNLNVIGSEVDTSRYDASLDRAYPNLSMLEQKSSIELPNSIRDASIDVVILFGVAHHVSEQDLPLLLKEVARVLKARGKIILIEDTFSSLFPLLKEHDPKITGDLFLLNKTHGEEIALAAFAVVDWIANILVRKADKMPMPYNFHIIEEWKEIFEKAGFESASISQLGFPQPPIYFHQLSLAVMTFLNRAELRDNQINAERTRQNHRNQANLSRSEMRLTAARNGIETDQIAVPHPFSISNAIKNSNAPAFIFMPYAEVRDVNHSLRAELFSAAYETQRSEVRFVVYGADMLDKDFRDLKNVRLTASDFNDAYKLFREKSKNRKSILVSANRSELRKQIPSLVQKRIDPFLLLKPDDTYAALLYAITDNPIPGIARDNEGFNTVIGEFLRSEIRQYQANLVVQMAA